MFFRTASIAKPFIDVVNVHPSLDVRRTLSTTGVLVLTPSSCSSALLSPDNLPELIPSAYDINDALPAITSHRDPCTLGATYATAIPMYGLLYNAGAQSCDVSFARFETVFCQLSVFDVSRLRTEMIQAGSNVNGIKLPVSTFNLAHSPTRARLLLPSVPLITPHLVKDEAVSFQAVLSDVSILSADECKLPRNTVTLDPGCTVIFDNARYAHMVKAKMSADIQLTQVSFNLPNDPVVDRILYKAIEYPLFQASAPQDKSNLNLINWAAVSQRELLARVNSVFDKEYYSKPGLYWGKINTSTVDKVESFGMCDGIPADLKELVTQREYIRDGYIDYGIIRQNDLVCNLFETSKCARSLEVRTHILSAVNIASFPLGTQMDDGELYGMIEHYGMSIIAGPLSKLMQFAIFCARAGHTFPALRAAIYTNDATGQEDLRSVKRLAENGNPEIQCFGTMESNYAGPFALSYHDSNVFQPIKDVALLLVVDDHGNDVEVGQCGELAVTALTRTNVPMIKVREGVMVKRVSETDVEYIGERPELTFYDFQPTGKRVLWNDIVTSISPTLKNTFDGCILFQLLINTNTVTVAIYAAKCHPDILSVTERAIVEQLQKLLFGCNIENINVKWLEFGHELKRLPSYGMMTFVNVVQNE